MRAQIANYVANGGFEKYISCSPTFSSLGYIVTAQSWDEIDNTLIAKWNHYCYGAIPGAGFLYNYPRNDSAFALYTVFCLTCPSNSHRTHIRNTLKTPLQAGKIYCVKFFLNNSENSAYSIDAIDAYFGGDELDTISKAHVVLSYLSPQVSNTSFNYITDTVGWTAVTGTFTAQGIEKYMVIGNLRADASTNTIINNPSLSAQQWSACTIAIDDVSCIPIDLPAYAGPDTYVVQGGSVYIGRPRDVGIDDACVWYKLPNTTISIDTTAGIWVSPTATSTYMVVQDICGNIKRDTVVVSLSGTGISEMEVIQNDIKLFPNPANDFMQIQYALDITDPFDRVYIYNQLGQLIFEESIRFKNKKASVPVSVLENGVYSIELKNSSGQVVKKRFVVSH